MPWEVKGDGGMGKEDPRKWERRMRIIFRSDWRGNKKLTEGEKEG